MFSKFIKNSFLTLLLLSYVSTTMPMQPNPSWWRRAKNWWFHYDNESEAERKRKNRLRKNIVRQLIVRQLFVNGTYVLGGSRELYNYYSQSNSHLPTLGTIQEGLPKEQIELIRSVLLPMGVPTDTRISIEPISGAISPAAARYKELIIYPALFNLNNQSEQRGILAHEGSHILNNDHIKAALFVLLVPAISFTLLKSYDWASMNLISYLKNKYPTIKDQLDYFQQWNKYLTGSWYSNVLLNCFLFSMYRRNHESRADYDAAHAVGSAGLVSFFSKCSNCDFTKKELQIVKNNPVADPGFLDILQILHQVLTLPFTIFGLMKTHPSYEARIQALQMIDKK